MNDLQYGFVFGRRQHFDQLLWQTPVLSLTAQAFLLTIALGSGSSKGSRIMSALLSLITALSSIQLMVKHRYYERITSEQLKDFETAPANKSNGYNNIHEHRPRSDEKVKPWVRWSSYIIWMIALFSFAVVAVLVIFSVLSQKDWLS